MPPPRQIPSTAADMVSGRLPPFDFTYCITESLAPFLISRPSMFIPLILVSAENGMNVEPSGGLMSLPLIPRVFSASCTMLWPSGVSSAREDSKATSATCRVVVSEYCTADPFFPGWKRVTKETAGRCRTGRHLCGSKKKTEVLYINF